MVVARVCGLHRDECRHVNRSDDLWESLHGFVGSDLGLGLGHAWFDEVDQQIE